MITEKNVYLVRHGLREDFAKYGVDKAKEIEVVDPPLSPEGFKQAEELTEFFKCRGLSHIFSSPYKRCLQTAAPIAEANDIGIKVEYGIRESFTVYREDPPVMSPEEMQREFPRYDASYQSKLYPTFPETLEDMYQRTGKIVKRLTQEYEGNLLFIGHEYTSIGGTRGLLNKTMDELPLACPTGGVFHVRLTEKPNPGHSEWVMLLNADINHLSDLRGSFIGVEDPDILTWLEQHGFTSLDELRHTSTSQQDRTPCP